MTILFKAVPVLTSDDSETIEQINACLERLSNARLESIEVDGPLLASKLAWKLAVYKQVVLYRVVALTESAALNWNSDNILGAYLPARALVETSAQLLDFERAIKGGIERRDLGALDGILKNRIFGTMDKEWVAKDGPDFKAVNVLTHIDNLDSRMLKGIRRHYDAMSERCHPNYLGHHHLYSKLDTDTGTTIFSTDKDLKEHCNTILAALVLAMLDERCFNRLDDIVLRLVELQNP